ncbi:Ca2+-transporting ATPase [Nakamurella panacisegetis]|uniref:Ca2+-transporting ATPase n=1 Tax=Nakamurella panacisegetis TaxID=1090615 RepID=A0A1H0S9Q3_9ACTN|nr:cation-transporting P-type ATPase [Nakamurella panacisegetis]SDP38480.1 Ca2+-transporting ATPase [Nakamurella panacisegetis]
MADAGRSPTVPGSAPTGLSSSVAASRLERDGRNDVPTVRSSHLLTTVRRQLLDTIMLVLLTAAGLTALTADWTDCAVIVAVIVLNTILGTVQEVRSARSIAALADLTAPQATVIRDAVPRLIPSSQVVRGDLLAVSGGDIVAADATLSLAQFLRVDESMLTGESIPVEKTDGDRLAAGTVVSTGRGLAVVQETGARSSIGSIAASLSKIRPAGTPLQRQLATLGHRLAVAAAAAAVVVAGLNLAMGHGLETSVVLAISLAVAAIPESLPAVSAIALALAARRMAEAGVLARHLAAVEALGSVTVLAVDKTGTLTEGRMSVSDTWAPDISVAVGGVDLLSAAALCNNARNADDPLPSTHDDPLEVALVDAATAAGIDVAALRRRWVRVGEIPFDAAATRMQTTHRSGNRQVELCKGSPEAVLGSVLDESDPAAGAMAERWAAAGSRVIAVAGRTDGRWHLLGLVAITDAPRSTARGMIEQFRRAGIRPVMVTGDHQATAQAIASAIGLIGPGDHPLSAAEFLAGADGSVLARVRPEEKRAIVGELQRRGQLVAMTGDGVNDAPALRQADIGVAMGRRGSEVAKQTADLILTDDGLPSMISAVREGRRAADNLRRFLHYAVSGGIAEIVIMIIGPVLVVPVPLSAGQILWINLLTHGLPGVAMGSEPAVADVLTRPPRTPTDQLLDRRAGLRVALLGTWIATVCLLAGRIGAATGGSAQSTIFVALTFAQLGVAVALRPGRAIRHNPLLPASVGLNLLLVVLAVTWSPLLALFHTRPLTYGEWLLCVGAGVLAAVVGRRQRQDSSAVGGR